MTHEDARIILGNILDLAELADDFVPRLETALGSVVPNGEGEEIASALFVETVRSFPLSSGPFRPSTKPFQDFPYGVTMLYITRHPAALAQLGSLPQTPALAAYHNTTRSLAQQLSPMWDLPSLLIKPVQRFLKYVLLLHAIIEETLDSHSNRKTFSVPRPWLRTSYEP
jgi:hypothetical protein